MRVAKYKQSTLTGTLIIVFSFIIQRTTQHFITTTPVPSCEVANKCNHTRTPICGQDQYDLSDRLFLDECDMFEFNCDNDRAYLLVEMKICTQKCTQNHHQSKEYKENSIFTSQLITSQSTSTAKIVQNIIIAERDPKSRINVNEIIPDTTNIAEIIATKTITEPSITVEDVISKSPKLNSTDKSDIAEENSSMELDTITTKATHVPSTILVEVTKEKTTIVEPETKFTSQINTKKFNTINLSNFSDTMTIASITADTENSTHLEMINLKVSSTKTTESPKGVITGTIMTKAATNINSTVLSANRTCYPKQCFVPSTWETTQQNEHRDFYNILKQRFGNKIKILRRTTYFTNPLKGFIDNVFVSNDHEKSDINNI